MLKYNIFGGKREGGSGWGTHVNPRLIHVNVWQKPLQYYKVISLQLIKINEKKKRKRKYNISLSHLSFPSLLEEFLTRNCQQKPGILSKAIPFTSLHLKAHIYALSKLFHLYHVRFQIIFNLSMEPCSLVLEVMPSLLC